MSLGLLVLLLLAVASLLANREKWGGCKLREMATRAETQTVQAFCGEALLDLRDEGSKIGFQE